MPPFWALYVGMMQSLAFGLFERAFLSVYMANVKVLNEIRGSMIALRRGSFCGGEQSPEVRHDPITSKNSNSILHSIISSSTHG